MTNQNPRLSDFPQHAAKLEALGTALFGKPMERNQRKLCFKDPGGGAILLRLTADGAIEHKLIRTGATGVGEAALLEYAKGHGITLCDAADAITKPTPKPRISEAEDTAEEMTDETEPPRDPALNKLLDNALLMLSLVKNDDKRLQAIATAGTALHRFGKTADAIEVRDLITESALNTYGLDANKRRAARLHPAIRPPGGTAGKIFDRSRRRQQCPHHHLEESPSLFGRQRRARSPLPPYREFVPSLPPGQIHFVQRRRWSICPPTSLQGLHKQSAPLR
jgi:hypothetical protein